jgi:ABC-2 type transport system permease protein
MAQLDASPLPPSVLETWTATQSRAQLAAVAWLRWRIFVNNFRAANKKRSTTSLVAIYVLRVIGWAFFSSFFIVPIALCGYFGYASVANDSPQYLTYILWAVFLVNCFLSINASPISAAFDLTALLRFPLNFPRYLLIRLFFGLFAIPTLVANLALASAAIGIGAASPSLFPWAALVIGIFALHTVFFLRMIFAWVDRWLATRRAREIFGGLVLFASLGFQFLFIGGAPHRHASRFAPLLRLLRPLRPFAHYFPPSLAADAIRFNWNHAIAASLASLLGLVAFALVFLAIFAIRLQKEFRGESLSEAARRTVRAPSATLGTTLGAPSIADASHGVRSSIGEAKHTTTVSLPPAVSACLHKELIYLRRSGAQLYGLITPIFLVFIITRRNAFLDNTTWLLPSAVSYILITLLANLYNILGADGAGFNFYLLAPIRLRDVIVAKNLVSVALIAFEVVIACVAVTFIQGAIPKPNMLFATLTWAAFALLTNLAVGNLRSILAPMRFELGKVRRAPMAKGGALVTLGVLFGTLFVGIPIMALCYWLNHLWLATAIFALFDIAAFAGYLIVLARVDTLATAHRDDLIEALCKP